VRTRRRSRLGFLAPLAIALGGCTFHWGSLDESDEEAPGEPSGEKPELNEAQLARWQEGERHIADVIYQGAPIVASVMLPSGGVIDGLDRAWLPALPYAAPPLPWTVEELGLPSGVEFGRLGLEQVPGLLELVAAAAPVQRPTFWPYVLGETDATSIEDYLDRYQVGGAPSYQERLYAGLVTAEKSRGVSGFMNQFRPKVAPGSFSLLEFAVACPAVGDVEEMVGVVISVDKANAFGKNGQRLADGEPRLHVEYARMKDGIRRHVWDGADGQFVINPFRRAHPGQIVPVSVLGGTQVEHLLSVFQMPTGDWWVAYQHELLGYYPARLFSKLSQGACRVVWYAEVYRPKSAPGFENDHGAIKTEMGSGQFAEAELGQAAYVRNPRYFDEWWGTKIPDGTATMGSQAPPCYTQSRWTPLIASQENAFFFLGGPGGNAPECRWPSP
jgi:Neprosin